MPFTRVGHKFDQETFYSRWRYFLDLINPLSLLYSVDEVKRATSELPRGQRYSARGRNRAVELQANNELTIPFYHGKACAFYFPYVRLFASQHPYTVPSTLWHIASQCYYAGFNYCNGNLSEPWGEPELIASSSLAIGSSVAVVEVWTSYS